MKPIHHRSAKMQKKMKQYNLLRAAYIADHPQCEIAMDACTGASTEIHHMAGRRGDRLTDSTLFRATCRSCHRWVTDHSREAIQLGHSKSINHKKID